MLIYILFVYRGNRYSVQYFSNAERAKSVLRPDVIDYANYIMTKNGMREHKNGRRRNNYQKRSQVIKIDPITGEKIYPPGHPLQPSSNEPVDNLVSSKIVTMVTNQTKYSYSPWSLKPKVATYGKDVPSGPKGGAKLRIDWSYSSEKWSRSQRMFQDKNDGYVELPTKSSTEDIPKAPCDLTRDANGPVSTLALVHHMKRHKSDILGPRGGQGLKYFLGRERKNCGSCDGCLRNNCGNCLHCKDKKFVGPNKVRKRCLKRLCIDKAPTRSKMRKAKKAVNENKAKKLEASSPDLPCLSGTPDPDFNVIEVSGDEESSDEKPWRHCAKRTYTKRGIVEI